MNFFCILVFPTLNIIYHHRCPNEYEIKYPSKYDLLRMGLSIASWGPQEDVKNCPGASWRTWKQKACCTPMSGLGKQVFSLASLGLCVSSYLNLIVWLLDSAKGARVRPAIYFQGSRRVSSRRVAPPVQDLSLIALW